MTREELRLDAFRSWLFCLAMIACDCDTDRALPLFERFKQQHGMA